MSDADTTAAAPPLDVPANQSEEKSSALPSIRSSYALNFGPPSQSTREGLINSIIETLSTPSFVSWRYGIIPPEEAAVIARRIEEEAFTTSTESTSADDDGLAKLRLYSRGLSTRMLAAVKARGRAAADTAIAYEIAPSTPPLYVPSHPAYDTEEVSSSVEAEAEAEAGTEEVSSSVRG
ncbi:WPP domain-containing protein 2 [Linum grandiflorum]